jgi:RNA polymerase sigma-70 factor, ECF subfamily
MNRPAPILVLARQRARTATAADDVEVAFRLYSGYVASLALRLLGRRDDVDDVVQEVFLAALKGIAKLRDPVAIKAWLGTVTARVVARRLRIRRFCSLFGLEKSGQEAELAIGATQEQAALVRRIYEILDELPVDLRIAWTLRHVQGEQLDAVAAIGGCSLATAKRRIAAAQEIIETRVAHE